MIPKYTRSLTIVTAISAALLLSSCGTSGPKDGKEKAMTASTAIDSALERAAATATEKGNAIESIAYLEKIYKRNPDNMASAVKYATALRESGYVDQAELVLSPIAHNESSPAEVKAEFAALQLAQGNHARAEEFAKRAVIQDHKNYRAFLYLGIALDSLSQHAKGERAFRKALEYWKGDPTPVMNNLALNLASQGYIQEALEILYRAKAIAPNRLEVERNLRIVTALQQSQGHRSPKPLKKPGE